VIESRREHLALLGGQPVSRFALFPRDRATVSDEGVEASVRVLRSGALSMFTSPEIAAFEEEFAEFVQAKHVVMVNSCTTAILASLMAEGVGPDDYVAVPAYTYIGSCMPILALGARPLLVDIDLSTQSMNVTALRIALDTYRVRAVIHVHLFGLCTGADEVADLCREHGAAYVADCAQFLGDSSTTRRIAERGVACFSFGESKLLRLGEGGAVATNSSELAERIRLARHEGELWTRLRSSRLAGKRPTTDDIVNHLASVRQGLNFRPLATAAAIGRVMLKELPAQLRKSAENAALLSAALADHPELNLPGGSRTWWTYPLRIAKHLPDRDLIFAALLAEGVPVGAHFPRLLINHPVVKELGASQHAKTPGAAEFAGSHLVLPIYPGLDKEHMRLLAAAFAKVLRCADELSSRDARRRAQFVLKELPILELCDGLFVFLSDDDERWSTVRSSRGAFRSH
jgi:perosamine synthetase